ncbi:MAG TPA: cytochrome c oxidase subunit II [Kineosporiaceae bacterium]
MRSHEEGRGKGGRSRRAVVPALVLPGVLLLSGCSKEAQLGFLGTPDRNTTNQTARIIDLWNGSWVAALAVGALVWGLMIWCMIVYRRRKDDHRLPPQVRYNIPLEILYIVVPIMMVAALFIKTADAQAKIIDISAKPDLTINVVGKQWSWDFNYRDANVYETGIQGELDGKRGVEAQLPTLYLPVNKRVEFIVTSRDVIHAFWIPATLFKIDAIPGVENKYQMVPQVTGTFKGKCSELCGEFHSEMLFNVAVVSQAEFDQHMADLRAKGHVGQLDTNLGRSKTPPGGAVPFNGGAVPTESPAASTGTGNS